MLLTVLCSSPAAADEPTEVNLFAEEAREDWEVVDRFVFQRHGPVGLAEDVWRLNAGRPGTGIRWAGEKLPSSNYELRWEARRVEGRDFFCGLTFPVGDEFCTWVIGGWGGGVSGLSNVDDASADENATTDYLDVENGTWYRFRLRVTDEEIRGWIDDEKKIDLTREGRRFSIWWEQEPLRPLGLATWYTTAEYRNLKLQRLQVTDDLEASQR